MKLDCLDVEDIVGFDWDKGNINKNEQKHNIKWGEIEEIFFNEPLLLLEDAKHSSYESRCIAFGKTDTGKLLTVIFTIREKRIRAISARAMSKKERVYYEKV